MLRWLFRWIRRAIIAVIVVVVLVLIVSAITDYSNHHVASGSVLMVTLDGPVVERGTSGLGGLLGPTQTPLNVVRRAIDRGARDPRIVGLAIKVLDPTMELAQAQELVAAIARFRASGKWTTAYLQSAGGALAGNLPYMVAAAAGKVSLMPQGELDVVGVGLREIFARGFLDWIGVRPNFAAIGQYKDAANIFTQKDFTPAQKEEDDALVNDMYEQIVGAIAAERRLSPDQVSAAIDQAPLTAQEGLQLHLVDRLEYQDQFTAQVKNHGNRSHPLVDYARYASARLLPSLRHHDRIAVIYGVGAITLGTSGFDPLLSPGGTSMGSDEMVAAFESAREDDSIRAVIFRIDSPGGSALASELIRRQVQLTAQRKPVVVSMSGYGASGGYWIATSAAKIFADPGTITGSIGVLGGKFNVAPALAKLGVNSGGVTRGQNVEMFDAFTDFTPAQQKLFQERLLGSTYNYFVQLAAAHNHLTFAQTNAVAQGRVWTGRQALSVKLIDHLGGFDAALKAARRMAKLPAGEQVEMVELPRMPSVVDRLLSAQVGADARASLGIPMRELRPFMAALRVALVRAGGVGRVYCALRPVM